MFFGEVLPNPKNDVFDIEGVAGVAHANGIVLIVDNTVPTPYLIRPLEWGADIVVHSLTKFMGGHGTSIAGAIVDGGTFDYAASGRFPNFTEPDPSYHGLAYFPALGHGAFILKARVQMLRDIGAAISPFNAFLLLQGIETLSLRMERHFANADRVAKYLDGHAQVSSVQLRRTRVEPVARAGEEVRRRQGLRLGASRSRSRVASKPARSSSRASRLHSHVANIGDARSLVIHPASTTHSQLTPEEQAASDVTPGLVRLSVGLESIDDILADLEQGFAAARLNARARSGASVVVAAAPRTSGSGAGGDQVVEEHDRHAGDRRIEFFVLDPPFDAVPEVVRPFARSRLGRSRSTRSSSLASSLPRSAGEIRVGVEGREELLHVDRDRKPGDDLGRRCAAWSAEAWSAPAWSAGVVGGAVVSGTLVTATTGAATDVSAARAIAMFESVAASDAESPSRPST